MVNIYKSRFLKFLFLFFPLLSFPIFPQIVINEFNPAPVSDEPEWVEIFNCSDFDYISDSLKISDATGTKNVPAFTLEARQYALFTKDSVKLKAKRSIPQETIILQFTLPSYNNTTDEIVIRSKDGAAIDSVYYDMDWGFAGISFERIDCSKPVIDQENIKPSKSLDSATAGYQNSTEEPVSDAEFIIEPNPFSPNSAGKDNICKIIYHIEFNNCTIKAIIYDPNGALIKELVNSAPSAGSGLIVWDGTNDKGYKVQAGPYILLFEASNSASENIFTKKAMIVVGD